MFKLLLNGFLILLFCTAGFAQKPFYLNYKFRLFNPKGQILTRDSLAFNTLFLIPNPGIIVHSSMCDTSHYFSAKIRTTWPIFRLVWNRYNEIMEFTVDHITNGKTIIIDSLIFSAGKFYIEEYDDKTWWKGLNIKIREDAESIHLEKFSLNDFTTKETLMNDKKFKKVKLK
ncbi:MAG: hypothetical protein A2275_02590 [Bacteroidetes bacterium RIFOXYA12_FULL_35_11]|nr:MAG: hypothetical protein A2X01_07000 [Bacteroidetes bacterium GWF2_35_48]OFY82089.1 MAG: hypothetical protein A2275_02590 [Bacteroidetes bacterium RIFOXYA12_FULL_35_11]HBX53133.1 hypothetical protein [Bacteroidales bacterium]